MRIDAGAVTELLAEISCNIVMPRYGRLRDDQVKTKSGPNDLVTEVDEEAEAFLSDRLRKIAPQAVFIGEESAAADPAIVKAIEGEGLFWIADPLDGTRNFVRGNPEFATIIALVKNGETIMGWIYAHPEGKCATAERGGGAFWDGAAVDPLRQSDAKPSGLRSIGWLSDNWRQRLDANIKTNVGTMPGHCSAYAYLKLLKGETDFKVSSRIHPWDHLAGTLMLTEAGGRTAWLDTHQDYQPIDSDDRPLLATAPGRDWKDIAARLTA
jgi:fructose-1,6-bisphosphatase/inositol monophosphatase family enzyme